MRVSKEIRVCTILYISYSIDIMIYRVPQDEDRDAENITATVDDAGEGIGVCRTTKWSEWSPCSATCGIGISMRTKTFIEHIGRKKCPHISVGMLTVTICNTQNNSIYKVFKCLPFFMSH